MFIRKGLGRAIVTPEPPLLYDGRKAPVRIRKPSSIKILLHFELLGKKKT